MKSVLIAVALLAACRGSKAHRAKDDAGPRGSASAVSARPVVPKLPRTEDGATALRRLDREIELAADSVPASIARHLERASITGQLDDYTQALAGSEMLVKSSPDAEETWRLRVMALLRVHRFADARVALKKLATFVHPSKLVEHEITLVEASGDTERALAMRAELAKQAPNAQNLTVWAAALAQAGRADEAIAIIPKAAAAVRDNPTPLIAWLLFQWGRCYELKGELATAREFFAAAHERLPGYLEATTHLAQTMIATGDRAGASRLVDEALGAPLATSGEDGPTAMSKDGGAPARSSDGGPTTASSDSGTPARSSDRGPMAASSDSGTPATSRDGRAHANHRHPELLALAAELDHPELADEARAEWERYVAALPLAFSDHAARFYLKRDPARALELARLNHENRDTPEARALVVEAALAAGDPKAACAVVEPLVKTGTHAQRFLAWQALSRCGREADAERLGRELGIVH
jgi:tetratricopeptide (TPR) repeat protein